MNDLTHAAVVRASTDRLTPAEKIIRRNRWRARRAIVIAIVVSLCTAGVFTSVGVSIAKVAQSCQ